MDPTSGEGPAVNRPGFGSAASAVHDPRQGPALSTRQRIVMILSAISIQASLLSIRDRDAGTFLRDEEKPGCQFREALSGNSVAFTNVFHHICRTRSRATLDEYFVPERSQDRMIFGLF